MGPSRSQHFYLHWKYSADLEFLRQSGSCPAAVRSSSPQTACSRQALWNDELILASDLQKSIDLDEAEPKVDHEYKFKRWRLPKAVGD